MDPDRTPRPAEASWRFGAFVLWEAQRRLDRDGQEVRLGSRSFDLLLQLIKHPGEVLSKDTLLATVWAGVVVEEASVRVHMSNLRKALGQPDDSQECKEWISNIPLRGYRFNGRVDHEPGSDAIQARGAPSPALFARLPVRLTRLVGRQADIERIIDALDATRFVTLVGTGGIGKTSAAIRTAEIIEQRGITQVAFVDLSPLDSNDHVLSTVARALCITADIGDPLQAVVQRLSGHEVLLLLDNCEHVLDRVAPLAASLLGSLPGLRVLATSREPLRVEGEQVLRLSPLAVPEAEQLSLGQALRAPAVELFVERAAAAGAGVFNEVDAEMLAGITRQLDGIPLAIELVAARLGVQPIGELAARLNDHMRLYSIDKRAVLQRQTTLAATLDWSIALLDEAELMLFRRLSVFRGRFDVASALNVVMGDMDADLAFDALISLANKSLVAFDNDDAIAPYRLLITTRSYAARLLAQSGEQQELLRRHAKFMLDLMKTASDELKDIPREEWATRYAYRFDDVRLAIEHSLGEHADAETAASLVIASTPLWFHVSHVEELRDRLLAALRLIEQRPQIDSQKANWLNTTLISTLLHTGGSIPDLSAACDRALAGALAGKDRTLELQARWGRCTHEMFRGEYAVALDHSHRLLTVAQAWTDPSAINLALRVSAMAHHFSGHFELAREHSEASIRVAGDLPSMRANMVGVDPVVAAKAMLCRTLWVQGDVDKALETAHAAVSRAEASGSFVSLCAALFGACPVALWSGELELARRWIRMMKESAQRWGLAGWHRYAEWYLQGAQVHALVEPDPYVREVAGQLAGYDMPRQEMLVTFCAEWIDDGLIDRVTHSEGIWCAPEVWRAAGWRAQQRGLAEEAEAAYLRAIATARNQGALSWEFRAVIDLARLWGETGRTEAALDSLNEVTRRASLVSRDSLELKRARNLRIHLSCP